LSKDWKDVKSSILNVVIASSGLLPISQVVKPCVNHRVFVTTAKAEVVSDALLAMPSDKHRLKGTPQGDGRGNLVNLEVAYVDVDVSRATIGIVENRAHFLEAVKQTRDHVANFAGLDGPVRNVL
jgi:hypothetical protein